MSLALCEYVEYKIIFEKFDALVKFIINSNPGVVAVSLTRQFRLSKFEILFKQVVDVVPEGKRPKLPLSVVFTAVKIVLVLMVCVSLAIVFFKYQI